jgi:hypothetical protein
MWTLTHVVAVGNKNRLWSNKTQVETNENITARDFNFVSPVGKFFNAANYTDD